MQILKSKKCNLNFFTSSWADQRIYFTAFFLLLICPVAFAQEPEISHSESPITPTVTHSILLNSAEIIEVFEDSLATKTDSITPFQKIDSLAYPPKFKYYRRLGYNSLLYVGTTLATFGTLWVMPENLTHWDKKAMKEIGFFYKWNKNVEAGRLKDDDLLNWIIWRIIIVVGFIIWRQEVVGSLFSNLSRIPYWCQHFFVNTASRLLRKYLQFKTFL